MANCTAGYFAWHHATEDAQGIAWDIIQHLCWNKTSTYAKRKIVVIDLLCCSAAGSGTICICHTFLCLLAVVHLECRWRMTGLYGWTVGNWQVIVNKSSSIPWSGLIWNALNATRSKKKIRICSLLTYHCRSSTIQLSSGNGEEHAPVQCTQIEFNEVYSSASRWKKNTRVDHSTFVFTHFPLVVSAPISRPCGCANNVEWKYFHNRLDLA